MKLAQIQNIVINLDNVTTITTQENRLTVTFLQASHFRDFQFKTKEDAIEAHRQFSFNLFVDIDYR